MSQPGDQHSSTPATDWLAELVGVSAAELRSDPTALTRAMGVFGRQAIQLLQDLVSEDEATQATAVRRWEELRASLPVEESDAPPGQASTAVRRALNRMLTDIVERLEAATQEIEEKKDTNVGPEEQP